MNMRKISKDDFEDLLKVSDKDVSSVRQPVLINVQYENTKETMICNIVAGLIEDLFTQAPIIITSEIKINSIYLINTPTRNEILSMKELITNSWV